MQYIIICNLYKPISLKELYLENIILQLTKNCILVLYKNKAGIKSTRR